MPPLKISPGMESSRKDALQGPANPEVLFDDDRQDVHPSRRLTKGFGADVRFLAGEGVHGLDRRRRDLAGDGPHPSRRLDGVADECGTRIGVEGAGDPGDGVVVDAVLAEIA